jgi:hypothetical protein
MMPRAKNLKERTSAHPRAVRLRAMLLRGGTGFGSVYCHGGIQELDPN